MKMSGPYGCPECGKVTKFEPIGPYRSLCQGCGALVKNTELREKK